MAQPEYKVQVAIVKWLRAVMPSGTIIHHSMNEHQKRGKAGMLAAQRNKTAGVFTGFPDLIVCTFSDVFFLEVKAPKGRVSDNQKVCHQMLEHLGLKVGVVRSVEDVREFLQRSNIGFKEVQL